MICKLERAYRYCFALLLIFLVFQLFIRTNEFNISPYRLLNYNPKYIFKISDKVSTCNPVNISHQPYQVNINGVTYPQTLLLSANYSYDYSCLNRSSDTKVILAWNKFYGMENFGYGVGKVKPFANNYCPVTNCELTMDKNRLKEADYVIAHMSDRYDPIPRNRSGNARWIWMLIESPYYTRKFGHLNGLFNYTSDFLRESEFGANYESQKAFIWAENTNFDPKFDYSAGKTNFLSALISNCGAKNNRMSYLMALKKYVNVDIYGKCGTPCPNTGDCREHVTNKHKFFFAFENCICRDYITEKFFKILRYNVVPVVMGGGDYSRFIPKSAYINALDYESPQKLGEYLNYLNKNTTAYNEYFQWKRHVKFLDYTIEFGMICEMCIQLHLEDFYGMKQNVITDFDKYWNVAEQCKDASKIPQLSTKLK